MRVALVGVVARLAYELRTHSREDETNGQKNSSNRLDRVRIEEQLLCVSLYSVEANREIRKQ